MSSIHSVRARSQRSAAAAIERARLTVVANRPSSAPRAPFAVLVFLILGAGVVGLLMFNTQMQQDSIHATELQAKADRLEAESQALNLERERQRDPQTLAEAAHRIGMVAPENPAVVSLKDGKILGSPTPATAADAVKVKPAPTRLPGALNRPPVVREVLVPPVTPATPKNAQKSSADGPASPKNSDPRSTNKNPTEPVQGAPR